LPIITQDIFLYFHGSRKQLSKLWQNLSSFFPLFLFFFFVLDNRKKNKKADEKIEKSRFFPEPFKQYNEQFFWIDMFILQPIYGFKYLKCSSQSSVLPRAPTLPPHPKTNEPYL